MPAEHENLISGSTIVDANGNVTYTYAVRSTCPHNAAFFADPNASAIIAAQQAELGGYYNLGTNPPVSQETPPANPSEPPAE